MSDHPSASAANLRCTGRGLSIQAFKISDKIADVDSSLPSQSPVVLEIHPELCFLRLNGGKPLDSKKQRVAGRRDRWMLLRRYLTELTIDPPRHSDLPGKAKVDDYIDALVAAWTAVCRIHGSAVRIPDAPQIDAKGLRMEMWIPPVAS
jgi:predicted RNase H-like nuclease